jgi:hypothetical protein
MQRFESRRPASQSVSNSLVTRHFAPHHASAAGSRYPRGRCAARGAQQQRKIAAGHSRTGSGDLQGPVIVAMIAVWMMQPSAYEVIDVVAMRHCFVTAVRTMLV